jgi:8-oxo-dGTP pyrophosphatase MutT (NUDIX family)
VDKPTRVKRTPLYRGKMIDVYRDTLRQDGGTVEREVVEHADSVAVVALDEQDRVLLVQQYRHPTGQRLWELPAGICDQPGESAAAAARRELTEETGVEAKSWYRLVDLYPSPGTCTERVRVFLARDLSPAAGGTDRDAGESDLVTDWTPLADAVRRVYAGDITNGHTVAGLLAASARPSHLPPASD